MEISLQKTERTYIRLILGLGGAFVLLVLLCWGGFRFYRHWQEGNLVRRAAAYMGGGDLKAASLSARRALQLNNDNIDAMRVIAQIAEKSAERGALDWRKKVAALAPASVDDALALARCAMWFNEVPLAEKTLRDIEGAASSKPEFYAASGRLAEMQKDFIAAEEHWTRAASLAPTELSYKFQLALLRLGLTDDAKRQTALADLEQLRKEPKQRAGATRTLIIDGVARRADPQRLRAMASDLQAYPDALFSDRILYLEILRQLRDPAYEEYLVRLKAEVPAKPIDFSALLSWMIRNGMSADALAFTHSLPAETIEKWPVPLAVAEAHAQLKDWTQLERATRDRSWAVFDFLRRAYLSRALRGQDKQVAANQELAAAQKEASAHPQTLATLAQMFAEWGWQNEAAELLWILAKNPESRMQALQTLYDHYSKSSDTAGLYRTLTRFAEISPEDPVVQNNLAHVSLLLGADLERARRLAAELAEKDPSNVAYVSTHAFALYSRGDVTGALKVMDGVSQEQLNHPSVATYYGVILAAAGQKEKAREFLRRSAEATLLPEERLLVTKAENSLN